MKEEALHLAASARDPAQKLNLLREYLQAFTLRSWHESEAFQSVAFVGGTALRFLHGIARFSEDLDFSVIESSAFRPLTWMEKLKRDLTLAGFTPELRWNDRKTVHSGWIRISGLLKEAGLGAMEAQKLSIKVEIDTRPPAGAKVLHSIIQRRLMFGLAHYDLPSLLAGKLHALQVRPYTKGRDWYDLVWYLSQRPPIAPNLFLLQNALDQTQGPGKLAAADWCHHLRQRLATIDHPAMIQDIAPFLERPEDTALLTPSSLQSLLRDGP